VRSGPRSASFACRAGSRRTLLGAGASTIILGLLFAIVAATSYAGTYDVLAACDTPGGVNHAFVATNTDPTTLTMSATCPTGDGQDAGIHVGEVLLASNSIAGGAHAGYTITAPTGTAITAIAYRRDLGQFDNRDTIPALRDATGTIVGNEWCQLPPNDTPPRCEVGSQQVSTPPVTLTGLNTTSLTFGLLCVPHPPSVGCNASAFDEQAWFSVYSADVTITENSAPALGTVAGDLQAGGWLRGTRTLTLAGASDTSGIQDAGVSIDGTSAIAPSTSGPAACDFTYVRPCGDLGNATWSIDTSALPDGPHHAVVTVANAAGVAASATPIDFDSDNTAPTGPVNLTSSVGTAWQTSDSTQLTWTLPDQGSGSPITTARVATCDEAGQNCGPATSTDTLTGTSVHPGPGAHTERVWLGDAAGNASPGTATTVAFRFSATPPPPPSALTSSAGSSWQSSAAIDIGWTPPPRSSSDPPLARGETQVCAQDGSGCTAPQAVGIAGGRVGLPHEGALLVRAWDVDAAGLGDAAHAATTSVFYSRTPPVTTLLQTPPSRSTSRSFRLVFRSAPGGPAPVSQTTWTLCSKGRCPLSSRTTGGTIIGTAPGLGTWTLMLTPVDAASVRGAGASVTFVVLPRSAPRIHLKPSISHGRLMVRISAAKGFIGAVALGVRYRIGSQTRTLHRTVRVRAGSARLTIVSAGVMRATLTASFRGSERYQPERVVAHTTSRPK